MHQKIFISYSRADSEFAKRLDHDLDNAGFDSFLDQNDIPPGVPWDDAIQKALVASTTVVVVLSPESVSSGNVLDEIGNALRVGKRVIPVRYKVCEIPLRINRLQYADFTGGYDAGLAQLITAIKGELATQAIQLPPPPPPAIKQRDPEPAAAQPRPQSRVLWIAILITLALLGAGFLIWRSAHPAPPAVGTDQPPTGTSSTQPDTSTTEPSSNTTATTNTSTQTVTSTTETVATNTVATIAPHRPVQRPPPPPAFVCDEDKLPACCRDSSNPVECRKCKKKLDIADRCE